MLGTTSRRNSKRLFARSRFWSEIPVTFPLGRAKLLTIPVPRGSFAKVITGSRLCHCPNTCSGRKDHVWIKLRKLMSILSVKFLSSFRPSKLQLYGLPLDPAETLQAVNKRACPRSPHRRSCPPKKCYDGRLS